MKLDDIATAVGSAYMVSPHFFHVLAVAWKAGVVHAGVVASVCVACIKRFL